MMPWAMGEAAQSKHKRVSIQNKRFTLVNNKKGEELFDLKNDPGETKNVINEYPEVVVQLRAISHAVGPRLRDIH